MPNYDSIPDYVERKTIQFQNAYKTVASNISRAAEKQENYQHGHARPRDFYVGQLVFLYSPDADRNARLPKKRNFIGPMRILRKHNRVNFTIVNISDPRAKPQKVHSSRLIPYTPRDPKFELQQPPESEFCNTHPKTFCSPSSNDFSSDDPFQMPEMEDVPIAYLVQRSTPHITTEQPPESEFCNTHPETCCSPSSNDLSNDDPFLLPEMEDVPLAHLIRRSTPHISTKQPPVSCTTHTSGDSSVPQNVFETRALSSPHGQAEQSTVPHSPPELPASGPPPCGSENAFPAEHPPLQVTDPSLQENNASDQAISPLHRLRIRNVYPSIR